MLTKKMMVFKRFFPVTYGVCEVFRYKKSVVVGSWTYVLPRRIVYMLAVHGKCKYYASLKACVLRNQQFF